MSNTIYAFSVVKTAMNIEQFKMLRKAAIYWSNYHREKTKFLRRRCALNPDYGYIHITP